MALTYIIQWGEKDSYHMHIENLLQTVNIFLSCKNVHTLKSLYKNYTLVFIPVPSRARNNFLNIGYIKMNKASEIHFLLWKEKTQREKCIKYNVLCFLKRQLVNEKIPDYFLSVTSAIRNKVITAYVGNTYEEKYVCVYVHLYMKYKNRPKNIRKSYRCFGFSSVNAAHVLFASLIFLLRVPYMILIFFPQLFKVLI